MYGLLLFLLHIKTFLKQGYNKVKREFGTV